MQGILGYSSLANILQDRKLHAELDAVPGAQHIQAGVQGVGESG